MNNAKKRHIPELGTVTLGTLSYGIMQAAYKHSIEAEENKRPAVFTNFILACMLEDPPQTPERIACLPGNAVAVLIDIAVDKLGIRQEFDSLPTILSPQERLYQACSGSIEKLSATVKQVAHTVSQQAVQYRETIQRAASIFQEQTRQMQQAVQSFHEQTARQQKAAQHAIASLGESVRRSLEEARVASQTAGTPLTQAGFWIPPSAPLRLLHSLRTLIDEGRDTPESIRQIMVDYYEADHFNFLRDMVRDWKRNPYFADRMHIINDALEAHIEGRYTLSIPTLLPLVEGILTDIVGRRATRADGGIRGWAGDALERLYSDSLREAYRDAVITYVTGITVYGSVDSAYFTPQRFPEWLELNGLTGDQVLQRHAILHGVQIDYASRENSLRAFFLLDVLSWTNRQEWDQRFQIISR